MLEVAPGVDLLRLDLEGDATGKQTVVIHVNEFHRLRDVELEVRADNFAHAEEIGYDLVAPMLSRWSFLHDVAITISGVQIVENSSKIHRWSQLIVGAVKAFSDAGGVSAEDHRTLLSAYREGISSTDPLWQALCLFRVAEGVRKMRDNRKDAVVAAGLVPAAQSERVPADVSSVCGPNDFSLGESLRPHAGKKFTAVLDGIRPALRNAIAHLDPDATILIQDRWADISKVERALPALRWIARQLLDAELQDH